MAPGRAACRCAEMADTFTAVDLSRLPAPTVVEVLDFDTIYGQQLAQLQQLLPDFDATVESDPAVKVLQVSSYREMLLRARVNDAAKAVMVAFATGADLDNLAAAFGVTRLQLTVADATTGAVDTFETDTDLRRRLTLAPEGYSVAGPTGAYIFHALSADADVLDASATSPSPGQVLVTVLSRTDDGAASAALVADVAAYLSAENRRPLTDQVIVQSAAIVGFTIDASLTFFAGPDAAVVLAAIQAQVADYLSTSHRLGYDITRASLFAALHAPGVQNIILNQPAADIVLDRTQAAWCLGKNIVDAGVAE